MPRRHTTFLDHQVASEIPNLAPLELNISRIDLWDNPDSLNYLRNESTETISAVSSSGVNSRQSSGRKATLEESPSTESHKQKRALEQLQRLYSEEDERLQILLAAEHELTELDAPPSQVTSAPDHNLMDDPLPDCLRVSLPSPREYSTPQFMTPREDRQDVLINVDGIATDQGSNAPSDHSYLADLQGLSDIHLQSLPPSTPVQVGQSKSLAHDDQHAEASTSTILEDAEVLDGAQSPNGGVQVTRMGLRRSRRASRRSPIKDKYVNNDEGSIGSCTTVCPNESELSSPSGNAPELFFLANEQPETLPSTEPDDHQEEVKRTGCKSFPFPKKRRAAMPSPSFSENAPGDIEPYPTPPLNAIPSPEHIDEDSVFADLGALTEAIRMRSPRPGWTTDIPPPAEVFFELSSTGSVMRRGVEMP